eukprot:2920354-Rhodomonas_salina.2
MSTDLVAQEQINPNQSHRRMSKEAAVVVAKPDAVMLERICNPDALKAQLEQLLEQLAPLDMTTNNTLSAKEFEIGLPPPRSLPAEVLPKTQEAEPAERLGTLVAQLEEAVKEAGEETMEGGQPLPTNCPVFA